jgi:hypothetical protein
MNQFQDQGHNLSPPEGEHADLMDKLANMTPPKLESIYHFTSSLVSQERKSTESRLISTDRVLGNIEAKASTHYSQQEREFLSSTNEFFKNTLAFGQGTDRNS